MVQYLDFQNIPFLIPFSITKLPFWGSPIYGDPMNPPICVLLLRAKPGFSLTLLIQWSERIHILCVHAFIVVYSNYITTIYYIILYYIIYYIYIIFILYLYYTTYIILYDQIIMISYISNMILYHAIFFCMFFPSPQNPSTSARHYPWNSKPTFSHHLRHGIPCERCAFLGGIVLSGISWNFSVGETSNIRNQRRMR